MNVCVLGWYYTPPLYAQLAETPDVWVVAHRPGPSGDLRVLARANVGLEWGGYSHYLTTSELGDAATLFMHDDLAVPPDFFTRVARVTFDVAFLFATPEDAVRNGGAHGRALYLSARMVRTMRALGGFWYDETNHGDTTAPRCNLGVRRFLDDLSWIRTRPVARDLRIGRAFVPEADFGYRGAPLTTGASLWPA